MDEETKVEDLLADDVETVDETPVENETEESTEEPETPVDEVEAEEPEQVDDRAEGKKHNFDKGLQKVQQEFSAFRREMQESIGAIKEMVRRTGESATGEQRKQAEKQQEAVDDLESLIEGADDDIVTAAQMRKFTSKFKEHLAQLREENQRIRQDQAQTASSLTYWQKFDQENPALAGKGQSLWQKALEEATLEGFEDANERRVAATALFKRIVKDAAKPKPTPPLSKKSDSSTTGAKSKPSGTPSVKKVDPLSDEAMLARAQSLLDP
jgi:hypothetical protein